MTTWQGEVKGLMYSSKVSNADIAKAMGVTKEYVAMIFSGQRSPEGAEERIKRAVAEIIAERNEKNDS